jgi:hypothetical protein
MSDAFASIGEQIDAYAEGKHQVHPFYMFEPWDVAERSPEILQQAKRDKVDLYSDNLLKHVGKDPHTFQTGMILSTAYWTTIVAGNQVGKSIAILIKLICMSSGDAPIAFQYEAGVDTGVPRLVTEENILRWGRRDSSTGEIIDHNPKAERSQGWKEWDCGKIVGAGIFPRELVIPRGGQIWLCTLQKALLNYWWPRFEEPAKKIIPDHMIDTSKGNNGYNKHDRIVYLTRDIKLVCLTYESGFDRIEAEMADFLIEDEEPPNEDLHQSAIQHTRRGATVETPYRGITWTEKTLIFPDKVTDDYETYHACQYDSPYQSRKAIRARRKAMKPWHISARCWGIPAEVVGDPYFDYEKLSVWYHRFGNMPFEWRRYVPAGEYHQILPFELPDGGTLPGLMTTHVSELPADEDNRTNTWRVYEERQKGMPYLLLADPAEGAEIPEEAADVCAAMILRPPQGNEVRPKIVATLRSTMETIPFARTCAHAARYWNNAVLGAETKRSEYNATFLAETRDWPYWYFITTTNDETGKAKRHKGFDPNAATRFSMYDLIKDWIDAFEATQYPEIPDNPLLLELWECIVGKHGRPDHKKKGTLDTATCFGIGLFIFKHSPDQVTCNVEQVDPDAEEREARREARYGSAARGRKSDMAGLDMMGYRSTASGKQQSSHRRQRTR